MIAGLIRRQPLKSPSLDTPRETRLLLYMYQFYTIHVAAYNVYNIIGDLFIIIAAVYA